MELDNTGPPTDIVNIFFTSGSIIISSHGPGQSFESEVNNWVLNTKEKKKEKRQEVEDKEDNSTSDIHSNYCLKDLNGKTFGLLISQREINPRPNF